MSSRGDLKKKKIEKKYCNFRKTVYFCVLKKNEKLLFIYNIMKKVFMSVAVVALLVAASACGNKTKKAEGETEAVEVVEEEVVDTVSTCCKDSTKACCGDSTKVAE